MDGEALRSGARERDGRGLAVALMVAVHGAALLLLRTGPAPDPALPRTDESRIRVSWSPRAPRQAPAAAPVRAPAGASRRAHSVPRAPAPAPTPAAPADAAASVPVVGDDAWALPAPAGSAGAGDFRRPLLGGREGDAPLAGKNPLPGLRMRDSSLGGRLQAMAKAYDCGELKAALRAGPGALVGGTAPGAGARGGGDASTDTLLATMRRLGCRM